MLSRRKLKRRPSAIANELVAQAPPDGYTLLLSPSTAIVGILNRPEVRDLWTSQGMQVVTSTPERLAAKMREDYDQYGKLSKAAGIKGE